MLRRDTNEIKRLLSGVGVKLLIGEIKDLLHCLRAELRVGSFKNSPHRFGWYISIKQAAKNAIGNLKNLLHRFGAKLLNGGRGLGIGNQPCAARNAMSDEFVAHP